MRKTALALTAVLLSGCGARGTDIAAFGTSQATTTATSAASSYQTQVLPSIEGVRKPFMWGVSTAGYQWEGQNIASQWFLFEMAGKTKDRAGKAADGFNRFGADADLARGMGVNTFRTSIEWSRIEPSPGRIDPAGVAFYHRLFQGLRARGLTPIVTLMHFSYPQWVEEQLGGWEKSASVDAFAKYVNFVSKEYAGEVDWWLTFNEPTVFLGGGYLTGQIAPGKKNPIAAVQVALNFISAHKKAYDIIHTNDSVSNVSFNNYSASYAIGSNVQPERTTQGVDFNGDWFMNAMRGSQAAKQGVKARGHLDYVALDYYCKWRIGLGFKMTDPWMWEVYPEGMYNAVKNYHRWTGLPVMVAENGFATEELKPRKDGWTREAYMVQHVKQMKRAMAEGVPVLGYVHWSITDNWEWGSFSPRFGLYAVDCRNKNFTRTPTPAVDVYKQIVANNGTTPTLEQQFPGPRG